jgi:hypothetical protein
MRTAPIIAVIAVTAIAVVLLELSKQGGILNPKLSFSELLSLAQNAGFQSPNDITAAAIALAESGGDPNAYNLETAAGAAPGQGSYGLWQIYRTAHPEFAIENLNDPKTNASAAFTTYQEAGGSFRPWTTFKNGVYLAHVPSGSNAQSV